jgi:predicted PhzF superfamily epimerase YddE/YHI9
MHLHFAMARPHKAGCIDPEAELIAHQGLEMGRAGRVRVRRNKNGRMTISGQAVPIFQGRMLV